MEPRKLPQARMYLKSAQWGFDELLAKKLSDYAFRFYLIGILASLRAVQHSLKSHDSTLSDEHKRVIDKWWQDTSTPEPPELHFIRTSRNLILKRGAFPAYAIVSESARFIDEPLVPAFRAPQLHGESPVLSLCHPISVGHG